MHDRLPVPDDLLARAVRGDRDAWAALLREHGSLVYGICRRLSPDPDDAYQGIWEKVFSALADFDPHGRASLRTWIATVAHRHLVDAHRRRRVRGEVVPLSEAPPVAPDAPARLRAAALEAALAALPEAHRRVVVMHHLHGLDLVAIAEEEGISVGTVKSRLHRGRARLAAILGGSP